ncbi:hypothetical protein UP17_05075 [Peribacillus simplex]|nr:hypothetical protein UP17_05075 [Peribacillus simplex]
MFTKPFDRIPKTLVKDYGNGGENELHAYFPFTEKSGGFQLPVLLVVFLKTAEMIYIGAVELEVESLPNHPNLIVRQAEKALEWDHMKEQLYLNKEIIMT